MRSDEFSGFEVDEADDPFIDLCNDYMYEECGIRIHVHMIHSVSNSEQLGFGTCVCLRRVCTYNEYDCFLVSIVNAQESISN